MNMGYYRQLQEILRPLRVYELDSGISGAELFAEGEALDGILELAEEAERESILSTAQDIGLDRFAEIMPFLPAQSETEKKRQALMALARIDWCSFTPEALRDTLRGCGVAVGLEESEEPETVDITLLGVRGIPENFEDIAWRVEQIVPCHLNIRYIFTFLIWRELEEWLESWNELEAGAGHWAALESLDREVQ